METKIIKIDENNIDEKLLERAGNIIKQGGLVAFPTETVYGLGGDALNPESARKIYAAKGRPSDNPLIIHIARLEDILFIVSEFSEDAKQIAEAFWPGPLTMILPKSEKVPYETTGGLNTVAVRMPSHKTARQLILYSGGYIAAPSANLSGKPSPTQAKYVKEDMEGRVEVIIDGGEVGIGLESTIVDLTVSPPQILRPGFITQEMLSQVLEKKIDLDQTILKPNNGQVPKAPGMKYRHYAPKGELIIVEGKAENVISYINKEAEKAKAAKAKVGVIATEEQFTNYRADVIKNIGSRKEEEIIARNLYSILREFDDENVTKIFSESFTAEGFGQAIMNRLLKAAGHKVVYLDL